METRLSKCNPYGWPEDVKYLIARVRRLTDALEFYATGFIGEDGDEAREALEES